MSNDRFPEFCQFRMEKKEFAVEMKTLHDFPYFLMRIRPFDVISNYNKTNLGIYIRGGSSAAATSKMECFVIIPRWGAYCFHC